jgi:hypothetical protein
MNGPDHYREAERLLDEATSRGDFNPRAQWCLELAKLHTALAHVAATAQASDVATTAPVGPAMTGRIPAIVATLATDGWDRIGFNG